MLHAIRHRSAFTLVEMSIVLVVIGLLVGGVVATRSYIKNAEMTALINESKFYINAFGQFQERYRAVPGDLATASSQWSGAHNGDGNGQIQSSDNASDSIMAPEIFYAFEHLNLAQLIDGSYSGATAGGPGTLTAAIGVNLPRSAFPGATYMFDHPAEMDGYIASSTGIYFNGYYGHVMRVAGMLANTSGLPTMPLLTPEQALRLDTKFDDGKPSTGWIMTPRNTALSTCSTTDNVASAAYNVNVKAASCYFILKVQ